VPCVLYPTIHASLPQKVTGDNIETARAIAKQCGIIKSDSDLVIEGSEFRKLDKKDLLTKIHSLRVLARSSPNDKQSLVNMLKADGDIVAVTGDGTNGKNG
jgi:Ca2+-transporting ATPase